MAGQESASRSDSPKQGTLSIRYYCEVIPCLVLAVVCVSLLLALLQEADQKSLKKSVGKGSSCLIMKGFVFNPRHTYF